jgi:hypothetical protein
VPGEAITRTISRPSTGGATEKRGLRGSEPVKTYTIDSAASCSSKDAAETKSREEALDVAKDINVREGEIVISCGFGPLKASQRTSRIDQ